MKTNTRQNLISRAHKELDKFLTDFRKSDGGYAPFTKEDEQTFHQLLQTITEAKFEQDPEGDYPLEFKLINRTCQEPSHYFVLPYLYKIDDTSEALNYMFNAQVNVKIATEAVSRASLRIRAILRDKKEDVKPTSSKK